MIQGKSQNRIWGTGEYDEFLAGIGEPAQLRELDRRGMTPPVAAALDAGSGVSRLMSLLDRAEATDGATSLDRIEALLTEQVQELREVKQLLNALLRIASPRAARQADEATLAEKIEVERAVPKPRKQRTGEQRA